MAHRNINSVTHIQIYFNIHIGIFRYAYASHLHWSFILQKIDWLQEKREILKDLVSMWERRIHCFSHMILKLMCIFVYDQYVFLQQWEDRLEQGIRFGKVLLLQNFDPQVTSADVQVSEKSASLFVLFM